MKKIMGLWALCVLGMASCQKEPDASLQGSDEALTGILVTDMNTGETTTAYELGQRHRPERDSACRRIPVDSLSPTILDYITTNYAGAIIKLASKDKTGNIIVIIKLNDGSFKILQFDANGLFLKELIKRGHHPKGHKNHLTEVDITTLLIDITTYIDANYAGSTIERAGMTRKGEFIISINYNGSRKLLLFDFQGVFLKVLR
ncbi:MAG: hypothetical protein IPO78_04770 [Saprospiraceae bacterium]|nr:hypothetical protein [Saprospiraceae bacterium]